MCILPPGNPARYWVDVLTAGLLTRGLSWDVAFPVSQWPAAFGSRYVTQSAYSCGGSHGVGPDCVVRTVFPITPPELIRRGTVAPRSAERRGGKECGSTCRSRWSPSH